MKRISLKPFAALWFSLLLASCSALAGSDGKDGKDAKIEVNEDGYISIDEEPTDYFFVKNESKVRIAIEHDQYGSVSGQGDYPYGTAVLLSAKPKEGGVFVGWKSEDGALLSQECEHLIVTDYGENLYTAVFASSPEYVEASIHVRIDEGSLPNASYTGPQSVSLLDGVTLSFEGYGEKSLLLYPLDAASFALDGVSLRAKIASGEIVGKSISFEETIALFDAKKNYFEREIDFYYYVEGKEGERHTVEIASVGSYGQVLLANGLAALSSSEELSGTVLRLIASPFIEEMNGHRFEASSFGHWEIDGKRVGNDTELVYTVSTSVRIVAHFVPKTKFKLTLKSGESGLKQGPYEDFKTPSKAALSINGMDFKTPLSWNSYGRSELVLGYFEPQETFSLSLKLYSKLSGGTPVNEEDTWKYIHLSYFYSGQRIGEGNSLRFFVPPSTNDEASLTVEYIRTFNYFSEATNEEGENEEYLSNSGFGLFD